MEPEAFSIQAPDLQEETLRWRQEPLGGPRARMEELGEHAEFERTLSEQHLEARLSFKAGCHLQPEVKVHPASSALLLPVRTLCSRSAALLGQTGLAVLAAAAVVLVLDLADSVEPEIFLQPRQGFSAAAEVDPVDRLEPEATTELMVAPAAA